MPSVQYTIFLVTGMLITGACNTLLNKLQDKQCVKDCETPNPKLFEQPLIQTLNMFMGEACCLVVNYIIQHYSKKKYVKVNSNENVSSNSINNDNQANNDYTDSFSPPYENNINIYSPEPDTDTVISESINKVFLSGKATLLLWIPSILDICGTTLMNVGLIYVAASVYQMLRGAVVIFTGFFSVMFLKRKLSKSQWIALFLVMTGVSIVGMSNIIAKPHHSNEPVNEEEEEELNPFNHVTSKNILGVSMVILAQIFTALQFIIEEKIMSRYEVGPLKTVGFEGSFGLFTVLAVSPFLYLFIGRHQQGGFFDIPDGISQIVNNNIIFFISIGCICSIAFFNWFGLSVTNAVSATSRSTIDTCRTVLIWMISLYLGWETFNWYQVLGFIVLIYGTFIFNGIISLPFQLVDKEDRNLDIRNENRPLLDENSSPITPDEDNHFANIIFQQFLK